MILMFIVIYCKINNRVKLKLMVLYNININVVVLVLVFNELFICVFFKIFKYF